MKLEILSKGPEQTMAIAEKFASTLKYPCVISLRGELGAGKTTFAKGFAKGLGVKEVLTSPTFAILNEYNSGCLPLYHFDLYRINGVEEAYSLGFEEFFDLTKLKGISLVEWAENADGILPMRHIEIDIQKIDEQSRKIVIEAKNEPA